MRTVETFYEVLIILLHKSIQTVKFSLKSVNLCKFTAWCPDVLADKPHPQFDTKILSKKVRLIRRCLRYIESKPETLPVKNPSLRLKKLLSRSKC